MGHWRSCTPVLGWKCCFNRNTTRWIICTVFYTLPCLCFPLCRFLESMVSDGDVWAAPHLDFWRRPETWSQDGIRSLSVSCGFRGFCNLQTSSRWTCKQEEFCLNRLMGHRVQVALTVPSDQILQGCREPLSPHVLLFGHSCQRQECPVHLKLQDMMVVCV